MYNIIQTPNEGRDRVNQNIGYILKCIEVAKNKKDNREVSRLEEMVEGLKKVHYCPYCGETLYKHSEEDSNRFGLDILLIYECDSSICKRNGRFYQQQDDSISEVDGLYKINNKDNLGFTIIYPDGRSKIFSWH